MDDTRPGTAHLIEAAQAVKGPRPSAWLLVVLLSLSGCDDPNRFREITRTPSPDGRLDAVLAEHSGDATTGLYHDVYVVRHDARLPHWRRSAVAVFEWAYMNDSTVGVTFRWRGDTLALEFQRASRQALRRPTVDGPNGPITVVLARGVVNLTPQSLHRGHRNF